MGLEIGQYILNVGVLDIDDVILNTLGCILGFIINQYIYKNRWKILKEGAQNGEKP